MTVYPSSIDTTGSLATVVDNATSVQGIVVNRLRDAILAIEQTLGIKPQGTYTTVRARLDALEALIAAGGGGGGGGGGTPITFAGDLTGLPTHQVVVGFQNRPVSPITPLQGQTYIFDGYQWNPSTNFFAQEVSCGPLLSTSVSTGLIDLDGKLILNNITTSLHSDPAQGIIYFDSNTNKFLVSENGGAYVDLIGGSSGGMAGGDLDGYYPNPTVVRLQTTPINPITPLQGQALIFDGYMWSPGTTFFGQGVETGPLLSTSVSTGLLSVDGKIIAGGVLDGYISDPGQGIIYFDSNTDKFLVSENGAAYVNLVGGGGSGPLVLCAGFSATAGSTTNTVYVDMVELNPCPLSANAGQTFYAAVKIISGGPGQFDLYDYTNNLSLLSSVISLNVQNAGFVILTSVLISPMIVGNSYAIRALNVSGEGGASSKLQSAWII